ncbi:RHOMBOID-like protein 9, chloroplastic isoform X1 [Zingiber officinale]|uniref:RHOMBOID-like protein 9, chloroplastic isoform X1 n=1 Tax=Zingiber officinale TaxID=94328 RepID=UPI001C4B64B8|nr:RHOMBOID-like protein 9, chloroplastic isoform X1 [Zingiber officinale]XP_042407093.1 RHOMBOID-like protein 9, chloroplastic isoform X1 [Zingiber officinale]
MASVSICTLYCKDGIHVTKKVLQPVDKGNSFLPGHWLCSSDYIASQIDIRQSTVYLVANITWKGQRSETFNSFNINCFSSVPYMSSNEVASHKFNCMGSRKSDSESGHQRDQYGSDSSLSSSSNIKRQLTKLDLYFSKLKHMKDRQLGSNSQTLLERRMIKMDSSGGLKDNTTKTIDTSCDDKKETGLSSLEHYFGRLSANIDSEKRSLSSFQKGVSERNSERTSITGIGEGNEKEVDLEPYTNKDKKNLDDRTDSLIFGTRNIQSLPTEDEASDLYLISLLAAIDIAVYLFEIASPVNSEIEHLSLPLIYGAKINKLILLGEWWRLLTPMFLHSGFLHVALSCWVLLTYGPRVCKAYGPFTFFLMYILGGICGNLTSFLHTPDLTVCGTGPEFAIIGAWLVHQVQNKEVGPKEVSLNMFLKAVIATALSFVLSSFGRVDNWTHVSAVISGIIFGFLTSPTFAFGTKSGRKEGITLVQNPWKSLATFAVSILVLASLFLLYAPELQLVERDDFF